MDNTAIYISISAVSYLWFAICLHKITIEINKCLPQTIVTMSGLSGPIYRIEEIKPFKSWLAWIPVINLYLLYRIAGIPLSLWWLIILTVVSGFVPYGYFVWLLILWFWIWWRIAAMIGKPWWYGLLMLIPFINLIIMGLMAFSGTELRKG